MKSPIRIAAAGALALALAACGSKSKPDPYLQNLPEVAAITLDTSASGTIGVTGAVAWPDPQPVTTVGDDLAVVHAKAEAMNAALRAAFAHLEAITSTGGHLLPGGVKEWGPADRCVEPNGPGGCAAAANVANMVLRVRLYNDHLADFLVLARPQGHTALSDFKVVLAGYLVRGAMDHRGAGKLWVNFPNLHAAAPGFTGEGYLAAAFSAGPVVKSVAYRMLGFTRDPALHRPITAAFRAWRNGAGWVRARVAGIGDTNGAGDLYHPAGQPSQAELGIWRGAWAPTLGARAFTVIGGGDVTTGKYWFARACYPPGATLPSYKEWFECSLPNAPAACVIGSSGQGTVDPVSTSAATSWSQTTCAAADLSVALADRDSLLPPMVAPGDVNDDGDEDGDHTGLDPGGCPTNVDASAPDPTPPGMMGSGMM